MYTQCPQCLTIYEIDEDALQASLGIVRCGHCQERFDALRTLSDTLPVSAETALPEHATDTLTPTLTEAIAPDAIEAAAARRARKRSDPAAATPSPTPSPEATATPEDAWFDPQAGERARALIADAAGIPQDATLGDPAWQITDLPIQLPIAELDDIPIASSSPTPRDGDAGTLAYGGRIHATAESEPFTERWSLDIPDARAPEPSRIDAVPRPVDIPDPNCIEGTNAALVDDAATTPLLPPEAIPLDDIDAPDTSGPTSPDESFGNEADSDAAQPEPVEATSTTPVYVPPRRRRIRRNDWLWAAGCLILALALAAQVAWAQRVALVRDPSTQAWVLHACATLDCRLPPIRDVAKLELLSRDVRPDPDAAGALMITATVRNNAAFRQPWPVVVVQLTDLDNDVVAMRRFRPDEYMPDRARRAAGIAPGTTAAVAFEVADPGKRAVSFHFGFE
ncbi:MAG: DUF3426 domain-containing protein [Rhodanobacteraceae bacterium]|nr:MAG: DUF3426 domain-containing protein [Rhodanobacteraceae bacterium]